MNKENCVSYGWCKKYSEEDEDFHCEDCDHYISDDAIDYAYERMRDEQLRGETIE